MARESRFQRNLIQDIEDLFPGAVVLKNDSGYLQGVPDLSVFCGDRWAMLECKADADAPHQPNQDYYIPLFDRMSYASFIYPENKEEVLHELQQALRLHRTARFLKRQ